MKRATAFLLFATCFLTPPANAGNLTISPAALSIKGPAGRSTTQVFVVANSSDLPLSVTIEVSDVAVRGAKRVFVPAGESTGSIAALVTVVAKEFVLNAGEQRSVPVTFVMPETTPYRAVAVFFRALPPAAPASPRIRFNLGAVVDFSLTNEVALTISKPVIKPATRSANAVITQELSNVGPEPAMVKGIAAILNANGTLVGKAPFAQRRLLPGERNTMRAEYAGTLRPGTYRVLCSLEYAGETQTHSAEFIVQ
jgi:hypothetical protein